MARCKEIYKRREMMSSSKMVDKFARMSLTKPKTEVLHVLLDEGNISTATDVKPYKKKSPSISSKVAAARANTITTESGKPVIPWDLYHLLKIIAKVMKRMEIHKDDIFAPLQLKGYENNVASLVSYYKLTDWKYDRAAVKTLERIERYELVPF